MSTLDERVLAVGDVELVIDLALGARARSWTVNGLSLLAHHGTNPVEFGMYPMAPWAGRTRGNSVLVDDAAVVLPISYDGWALHGTVLDRGLDLVEYVQGSDHARLVACAREHASWPWPMEVDIAWDLTPRVLTTTITVSALEGPFPAVVGWHPWFERQLLRGGPLEWGMNATFRAERGADYLPTGEFLRFDSSEGPFDDTFVVPDGRARVRWPGALLIDIENDAPWFVVYDRLPDAACVEPQSGPPNGVNDGIGQPIAISAPGRPHHLTTRWIMHDDPPADQA